MPHALNAFFSSSAVSFLLLACVPNVFITEQIFKSLCWTAPDCAKFFVGYIHNVEKDFCWMVVCYFNIDYYTGLLLNED